MSDKPTLKVALPKAKRVKPGLLIALVGCVVLILLMASVNSLSKQPSRQTNTQVAALDADKIAQPKEDLAQLPESYGDAESIDRYLNQRHGSADPATASLRTELERMQKAQQQLKQQIQGMNKPNKPQGRTNPLDREAKASAIFFAGGAPRVDRSLPVQNQDKKDDDKTNPLNTDKSRRSAYHDQNMQNDKLNFLDNPPDETIYNQNQVQYPASKYIIQAGTVIPAILVNKLVSNLPGMIVARVKTDVYDTLTGKHLLIPKGTKLIGEYSSKVSYGQSQLQAKFTRLIREDGSSITLPNQAGVNDMGVSGFEDEVNNHWNRVMGSAFLMTVFNIPSIVASHQMNDSASTVRDANGNVVSVSRPLGKTVGAASLESVGRSVSQIGTDVARRSLNIQPTVTINDGYTFSVLVSKDIILPPPK